MDNTEKAFSAPALNILKARNEVDLRAATALLSAEKALGREKETDDAGIPLEPAARRLYLSLEQTRLELLYEFLCGQELYWYETYSPAKDPTRMQAIDLCRPLRHFLNELEFLRDGFFQIGNHSIPHFLYANLPHERLIFVLLHQILLDFSENPALNTVELSVQKEQNEIHLELTLRRDPEFENDPLPQPDMPILRNEGLPCSGTALTEQFCSLFRARLIRHAEADRISASLSFPAADPITQQLELHSLPTVLSQARSTACQAVLSCILPTDSILWSNFRDG